MMLLTVCLALSGGFVLLSILTVSIIFLNAQNSVNGQSIGRELALEKVLSIMTIIVFIAMIVAWVMYGVS